MLPVHTSSGADATTESITVVGVRSNALAPCELVSVVSVNDGTSEGAPSSPLSLSFVGDGPTESLTFAEEGDVRDQDMITEESCAVDDPQSETTDINRRCLQMKEKLLKMERNRRAAIRYREKKKQKLEELRAEARCLADRNQKLCGMLIQLSSQIERIRALMTTSSGRSN